MCLSKRFIFYNLVDIANLEQKLIRASKWTFLTFVIFIGSLLAGLLIKNRAVRDDALPYFKNLQTTDGVSIFIFKEL